MKSETLEYPSIVNHFVDLSRPPRKDKGRHLIKAEMVDLSPGVDVSDEKGEGPLVKSVLNLLNGSRDSVERLAFTQDPSQVNNYASVYRAKLRLIPDTLLKRIAIQDDLVAAIINSRCQQMSAFGRPRPDRFSTGFVIEPNVGIVEKLAPHEKQELNRRIEEAIKKVETCGSIEKVEPKDKCTFSQWLSMSARNALIVGRLATELVWVDDLQSSEKKFHFFRAIDAGTIYRANPQRQAAQSVRENALHLLEQIKNEKLKPERFKNDEYAWIQVIENRPVQAFTADECVVNTFYPVPDVELDGYPVTPIDTMISAVVTHINITSHNKIYFQTGRATRGMLVIKSDDVDENVVARVKQQFNASINSVSNAWRMPVFAIGSTDELDWEPIDSTGSGKDMEFQYLTDMNARVIFSAFQMSPEEVPGWSYLSRGTNNQALSECISGSSRILTPGGLLAVADVVGEKQEQGTVIWNGQKWVEGRVFKTGPKQLKETELACGAVLQSSPDHRFRVLGDSGEPEWRHQADLKLGDHVLVNRKPVEGDEAAVPSFNGRRLTREMMEILGWMTGDGCFTFEERDGHSGSGRILLFYHHQKERDVWERHLRALKDFGLPVNQTELWLTEAEQDAIKVRYGFKNVAESRIRNEVNSSEFCRWLVDFGFHPSTGGKVVPAKLHILPALYREAFLRGLFSADGGKINKTGSVALTIQNHALRDQVKQLLLGLGIRTLPCKGIQRSASDVLRLGSQDFSYKLFIKDRATFWDRIGFIQAHKQPDGVVERWQVGNPPTAVLKRHLTACVRTPQFAVGTKKWRDNVQSLLREGTKRKCSWGQLLATMEYCSVDVPTWMREFHVEVVGELRDLGQIVNMYDVEMYDNEHSVIINGMLAHNSNNEYKLEAARDVGIRPLIAQFEDFINAVIFPLIDNNLSKIARLKLIGLDAETAEKESVRLQQDMPVHMSYDQVLEKVEKVPLGRAMGGEFPLNPQYQTVLDRYFTVGEIKEFFFGVKGAAEDPKWAYPRDPFWFQAQQLEMSKVQMQQQAQQQQAEAQQQQAGGGAAPGAEQPAGAGVSDTAQPGGGDGQGAQGGGDPSGGGDRKPYEADTENAKNKAVEQTSAGQDLTRSIDQAIGLLTKGEDKLPPSKRKLLAQHRKVMFQALEDWDEDLRLAMKVVVDAASKKRH